MDFPAASLSLWSVQFFSVLEMTGWSLQYWDGLLLNTATVSFLKRMGCIKRGMQVLQVKQEEKIV